MKKILLALALMMCLPQLAAAQSLSKICFPTNAAGTNCQNVDASNPFPITGSISATSTAKATAAAPTYVEGSASPFSQDLSGNLRVSASLAFPTIGAAVPATGVYNALNVAGALRGLSGLSTGALFPAAVAIVDGSGTQITSFGATGSQSNAASALTPTSANVPTVGFMYGFNGTTWDQLQVDTSKNLKVNVQSSTGTAIGTTTSGSTGAMVLCATSTAISGGTNAQLNPLNCTPAGALRSDLSTVAGTTLLTGNGTTGTGSQRVTVASDNTPFGVVATIASGGVASGAFASGSIASGAIAAGAQVDLLTMRGTKAAGTAATNSLLIGGVYSSTPPTLTDGQQVALQLGSHGHLLMGNAGYPGGATPITISATGTTGATTATLATGASVTTYLCGFSIRANATAAATANSTVTGTITGTLNYTQWTAPNASGIGITEQIFTPCIPASAVNTGIAVISAAPGTGGVVSVTAWGFTL